MSYAPHAIVDNAAQVKIGGKQTYTVHSEYARWYDECTSVPGVYTAKLHIPTDQYDTELPYLLVEWDGIITACNWQPCFGGVPFGSGTDTRGKAMKGFTRIELIKALDDKRITWTSLRSTLEMVEQRCAEVLARLVERMNNCAQNIERDEVHMVGYYAKDIQKVVKVIEAIRSIRHKAIYDESRAA